MAKAVRATAKNLSRSFKIDRATIDKDNRKIELAFSSEMPVERWGENEILSHAKGDYDFTRLNHSHPLLLGHEEHDPLSQIGVIESARVDGDKIGRAVVRFGNSDLASEIWQDVQDGIRELVSVGYDRTGIVKSDKASDGRVTTRYKWEPTHIAIVPVPADTAVGVGRGKRAKRQCPDCEGSGRCRCRENDDDDADEDCKDCGGNGRCRDCDGKGYFESAKSKQTVDSPEDLNVTQLAKDLTPEQKTQMRILLAPAATDPTGPTPAEIAAERAKLTGDVQAAERIRVKEISDVGNEFSKIHRDKNDGKMGDQIAKLVGEAIENGDSVDKFKSRAMEDILKAEPARVNVREFIPEYDLAQFSLIRAIQQSFRNREKGNMGRPDDNTVEGDIIKAFEDKCRQSAGGMGFEPAGFVVPPHVQIGDSSMSRQEMLSVARKYRNRYGRDMQATIFPQGGALVPTLLLTPIIELLRNKSLLNRVGVRTMGGLTGNVTIPRLDAPSTAYSVAEIAALTASQQVLGQISMIPHRVGAQVIYSKQLVFQSTPDAEAIIRDDMMEVLALKKDYLGINGQGAASEPLGILQTPGIGVVTFGAAATYAKIVSFQTQIRSANVMGKLSYASTSKVKGTLKTTAVALTGATVVASGEQNALWHESPNSTGEEDGVMNGCQAIDTQQIPLDLVLAGVFNQFIEGIWGGFDVVVDIYTKAANAEVALTMNLWLDYAARHVQAFAASTDAGNQ